MPPEYESWEIVRKIGSGSFGTVYEIQRRDEEFGGVYKAALKVISIPQREEEIEEIRVDGMTAENVSEYFHSVAAEMVKEYELMTKLKGTTNIVSYEDHRIRQHRDGIGWDIMIRMELLTSLDVYIAENRITRRDIIRLGIDMCSALERCQKFNIIHRDIKPANIFISPQGDFKLGDFGIARTLERTWSEMSKKGTYNYMAPEVYKGQPYGYSVDLYSLGLVMYRLLNDNRLPFLPPYPQRIRVEDKNQALIRRMSGDPLPMPAQDDTRLAEIVLKACSYDPEERYSSPELMRRELQAILYSDQELREVLNRTDVMPTPPMDVSLTGEKRRRRESDPRESRNEPAGGEAVPSKEATVLLFHTEDLSPEYPPGQGAEEEERRAFDPVPFDAGSGGGRNRKHIWMIALIVIFLIIAVCLGILLLRDTGDPDGGTKSGSPGTSDETGDKGDPLETAKRYTADPSVFQGHAYGIFNIRECAIDDYPACVKYCEEMGGHMAVINSREENEFIYQMLLDHDLTRAMFGYSDVESEGDWKWVTGESGFENWDPVGNQPNNGANNKDKRVENYAEFSKSANGTWNDAPFGVNTYRFICEWE